MLPTTQFHTVSNFQDFVSTPLKGAMNSVCWNRDLVGDFAEIVSKVELNGNITELTIEVLQSLDLSEQGQFAREIIINDFQLLSAFGASPSINVIKCYDRDDEYSFISTDVYSFHVDRSPISVDTFLCTYYGDASEIVPNSQVIQKILVPEIRAELRKLYEGDEDGFDSFLVENFFDLHYELLPDANPTNLGNSNLWRLATDYPNSEVLSCVHRAPNESSGLNRLMLIC
ncbi:MAG: hypothetical protein RLZZ175_2938 [Bacteroidota bacterium]|jgi:hypothetical protein